MNIRMLRGKIHRATVTQADLNYVGSITIDEALLEASGILEYEQVQRKPPDDVYDCRRTQFGSDLHERRRSALRKPGRQNYYYGVRGHDGGRSEAVSSESYFCR